MSLVMIAVFFLSVIAWTLIVYLISARDVNRTLDSLNDKDGSGPTEEGIQ